MPIKVPLELVPNSNTLKAPGFCPYSSEAFTPPYIYPESYRTIDPSICSVCKVCEFVPSIDGAIQLTIAEKDKCIEYLTKFNTHLANIINGQISFLTKKNRAILALLVSANVLNNIFSYAIEDNMRANALFHYYVEEEIPILYLHGSPLYFSRRLTMSPIQVIGEAPWK